MRSDEDLLHAAAAGDGDAFAEFYRRHLDAITTFLRRRTASPEVAFDLTAETFAAAVVGIDGFIADRGCARGWLFGIAANELRQAWRLLQVEQRARRRLALEPIVLDDEALTMIEQRCDDGALLAALSALPPDERTAIEGRILDERDYRDLAGDLRCSEAVVRQRVSRGLRRLRSTTEEPS